MANKFFHSNNQLNCSKTEHWHLACPHQTAEWARVCVRVRDTHRRAREVIWYNNTKGLEGREFNDECAFTGPWLRLWAWNCPGAAEQHLHAQQRVVGLMRLGAAFLMTAQSSRTHTHTQGAFLLKRRTCGFGLTCKQTMSERLRGAATARWPQVLHQNKEKLKACIHFFSLSLFLSTQLRRLVMSLSNHFLVLLAKRSGFSWVSDSHNRLQ